MDGGEPAVVPGADLKLCRWECQCCVAGNVSLYRSATQGCPNAILYSQSCLSGLLFLVLIPRGDMERNRTPSLWPARERENRAVTPAHRQILYRHRQAASV